MRKSTLLLTGITPAVGALLAVLRYVHNTNYYTDGLPDNGFLSTFFTALPYIAIVLFFILAATLSAKKATDADFTKALPAKGNALYLTLNMIAAVLILLHGLFTYPIESILFRHHNTLGIALYAASFIALVFSGVFVYKGKNAKAAGYLVLIPPLYFCLQLVEIFIENIANPVLLTYSPECLSMGCTALYLLALAGVALKKDQLFTLGFSGPLALLFSIISLAGPQLTAQRMLLYIASVLIVLPSLWLLLQNLVKREKKKKGTSANSEE